MYNGIDVSVWKDECETYEFLNIADCLVTDYSSVFFDFAYLKKPILYTQFDVESLTENHGIYYLTPSHLYLFYFELS